MLAFLDRSNPSTRRVLPCHRTLLITLNGTSVRNADLTHLKASDVDSKRMVIHVQGGDGRKDVMLSPTLRFQPIAT